VLKLLRSWPRVIPEGRSYVVDDIERLTIENHHYGPLGEVDESVLLIEWDMAVGQEELRAFAARAQACPARVLVAPYRIYADAYNIPADIWAHRHWDGDGSGTVNPNGAKPIATGDEFCQLFGLGLVYLPLKLIRDYLFGRYNATFGDTQFSMWHYATIAHDVPVAWDVRPVHLNYRNPL
jgi:hypothetical protein